MYAIGNKDFAGIGSIAYNIRPYTTPIKCLKLSLSAKQFAYEKEQGKNFNRFAAEADFLFHDKLHISNHKNNITVKAIRATQIYFTETHEENFLNLTLKHTYKNVWNPYNLKLETQFHDKFVKSSFEANYTQYFVKNFNLDFRLFVGTFLYDNLDRFHGYNFSLDGKSGYGDYTYDEYFLGRYEIVDDSFLGQQFAYSDGAFASYNHFNSDKFLATFNTTSSIPYITEKLKIRAYANLGYVYDTRVYAKNRSVFAWESGLKLSFPKKIVEIFFPVICSTNLEDANYGYTPKYVEKIRFTLNLNALNFAAMMEEQM